MSASFIVTRIFGSFGAVALTLLFSSPAIATSSKIGLSDEMLTKVHSLMTPEHTAAVSNELERGGPVTLRVGSGCTYATVQAAINDVSPGVEGAIIRIRQGSYSENLFIGSKNIELIGGHSNCTTTTPTSTSTINGNGFPSSAIIFFPSPGGGITSRSLILRRLSLVGGTGTSLAPGGGLSIVSDSGIATFVTIIDVDLGLNSGLRGGGISMIQNDSDGGGALAMQNVLISANNVTGSNPFGGGLYCNGDFEILKRGGEIGSNVAGTVGSDIARGGGVYTQGCEMNWFADDESNGAGRLRNNTVHGGGGGLYATGGAVVSFSGTLMSLFGFVSSRPLVIETNEALGLGTSGGGGGVWADGATVNLQATWLQENNSQSRQGGAIAATGGALVNVNREVGNTACHTSLECSRIINNRAGSVGGAISVTDSSSEVNIDATVIRNNASLSESASSVFSVTNNGRLRVINSLVTRGEGAVGLPGSPAGPPQRTFSISSAGRVDIRYSTIADSEPQSSVFRFTSSDAELYVRGSILHEQSGVDLAAVNFGVSPFVDTDCSIWHSNQLTTLGGGGAHTRNRVEDPLFINRAVGNFELALASRARDYCNDDTAGFGSPPATDLLTRPRGVFSGQSALHGLYDIGAFEMLPDGLFSDRFEQNPF